MPEAKKLVHPLEPVFDENSRVLVLGSFPSPKSREFGFNYGHPQNRFWRVMAELFDEPFAATKERRRDFVLRHHMAFWDVLASCTIEGASDTSIRDAVPNDFSPILEAAPIEAVFCTGAKAAELYKRLCEAGTGIPCIKLPSTSPANAAMKLDALVEAYRAMLPHLHEWQPPILDVAKVVELEHIIDAAGTPLAELMQRAGIALAHRVHALASNARVVVLCGSGNNGGDGWVAACELLDAGHGVCLVTPRPAEELRAQPAHDAAVAAQAYLEAKGAQILVDPGQAELQKELDSAGIIVDAILGTGFSGATVKEPYASWIDAANTAHEQRALVVAADVPSGLSAQTGQTAKHCIVADHTVTMIVPKPGLASAKAGRVHVAPLAYIEPFFA
ncbi:MAG: NAD(P)H-hydrate epimerase [Eggerthellaceae bacterium]|nr:NAD(P)H-hydrate epimerase [Eggerthellaceae bacterium]